MLRLVKPLLLLCLLLLAGQHMAQPRVIVSTDIGGTDDDDFQSMIHYLMYANQFKTEGLISSPYGDGRKEDILRIIDLYEKDYPKLKANAKGFPTANVLRAVVKQGATERAPAKGWTTPTEGSEWIISCAKRESSQPLWVLVWGGIEDLAQALHDAPEIAPKLRVYWIGGPNKKWGAEAYHYLVSNFPELWMIEANATYRGWFQDISTGKVFDNSNYHDQHIKNHGAMGRDFSNYYKGVIKMGDTPSVAYLLHGNPEKPEEPSWGGSFVPLHFSARRIFNRATTLADQVPVFGVLEWVMQGPDKGAANEEPSLWLEVDGQRFEGYYEGNGRYRARFVPKAVGEWSYKISSSIKELDGQQGQFTSTDPWPGKQHPQNLAPLTGWWSDSPDPASYVGPHQGAATVNRWQKEFLDDWAKRWAWLAE
ncbi:nucleoside hydrolase-like domain-containing protein [Pontibacter sp. 13R65]|uniref:nucleoside hydrolase-like domain-containing protein n=1 Tax=Pontibacter sp. 13R65 TaxID=3127458 RepID=UPI00301E4CEE